MLWQTGGMNAIRTARERARAELMREIKREAAKQLADAGAAQLSLRSVSRALGMASSAVYRYFPSRDELLTALITDAYNALGDAAERADRPEEAPRERWTLVCAAVREWAVAHPHEYALLYGTPVPGYRAPAETVDPGTRVIRRLAEIALAGRPLRPASAGPLEAGPLRRAGASLAAAHVEPYLARVQPSRLQPDVAQERLAVPPQ